MRVMIVDGGGLSYQRIPVRVRDQKYYLRQNGEG